MQRIEINQAQLQEVRNLLANVRNGAETAMSRSYNAGVDSAVTITASRINEKITLNKNTIKSFITKIKARTYKLGAAMIIKSNKIPLIQFQTSSWVPGARPPGGLTVQIWKDRSAQRFKHAFFAIMPNGHIGIFERRFIKMRNLPIDEMKGPYLATIYENTPGISDEVEQISAEKMLKEFERQTDLLLGR